MDIRYFAQRSHAWAALSGRTADDKAAVNNASQMAQAAQNAQAAQPTAATTAVAASEDKAGEATPAVDATAQQPATMANFSPAGRLLNVLQSFEKRHPDETKQVLSNIADKLRSDSEHAGVFSDRLQKWADRFQKAADTGDMSNLMPRYQAHFGMRAYQQNQQPAPEADETVDHVAGVAANQAGTPPAGTPAAAKSGSDIKAPTPSTAPSSSVSALPNNAPTAPQKSTLGDNEGASDMRSNQSPPIIVTDRATSVASQ